MHASFFELCPNDERFPNRWFLRAPRTANDEEIDPRDFTESVPYLGPVLAKVPLRQCGVEVNFTFASFEMPVVSKSVGEIIRRVAPDSAEYFPSAVDGTSRDYEIMNATCRLECLDEERSEFTMWTEEDERPEMMGHYRMISTIRIDPARAAGHHLFRNARWPLALLVSDTLKAAIEDIPNLGIVFKSVV
jgi:hypothetical protein